MSLSIGLLKKLRKGKLRNTIKELRDKLKDLNILNEIKKNRIIERARNKRNKKSNKKKVKCVR